MSYVFDGLRDVTLTSICIRLLMAVLCGGAIGIEREFKRRPAGFRTHILICLGAAMTTLTSQYLLLVQHQYTDVGRLGAQVVAGIGFIGAGTIIVTRRQRVKGLTTAAGLWAAAIVGLALGSGFYEGAIGGTVLILTAELVFSRLEDHILNHAPEINIFLEYADTESLDGVLNLLRARGVRVLGLEISRTDRDGERRPCAIFALRLHRKIQQEQLLMELQTSPGVISVEEL